jgi:hypothetical protein
MNYTIEVEGQTVILVCNREFNFADGIEALTRIKEDPQYSPASGLLILDPGSLMNPTMEDVRKISSLFTSLLESPFLRIALVVSKMVHFGIGRMTEALADPEKGRFKVFRSEKDAREWLATIPN